jgi:hypothetical protein
MNYCSYQFKEDRKPYDIDYIEFYHLRVNENILSNEYGVLDVRHLRNYIRKCVRLKKYDALNIFFKKYSGKINNEIRISIQNYAKGSVCFNKKDFPKSLEYLSEVNISTPMIIKDVKIMKLRIFYDLKYIDALISEVDSYRHFLKSTTMIPKGFKETDRLFLNHLIKLKSIRESGKVYELEILKKNIGNPNINENLHWLLEKIAELNS